jgi:hypothetical protein
MDRGGSPTRRTRIEASGVIIGALALLFVANALGESRHAARVTSSYATANIWAPKCPTRLAVARPFNVYPYTSSGRMNGGFESGRIYGAYLECDYQDANYDYEIELVWALPSTPDKLPGPACGRRFVPKSWRPLDAPVVADHHFEIVGFLYTSKRADVIPYPQVRADVMAAGRQALRALVPAIERHAKHC